MKDLRNVFCKKIQCHSAKRLTETRVIFDEYFEDSLKNKTRARRTTSSENAAAVYYVHENMSLQSLKLKDILSSTKTKQGFTKYLAGSLLQGKIIVVQGRQARGSSCDVHEVARHNHEEADSDTAS